MSQQHQAGLKTSQKGPKLTELVGPILHWIMCLDGVQWGGVTVYSSFKFL